MTDRINGVWVTFEKDMRDDDAKGTIAAIAHIRGVLAVTPNVADFDSVMAEDRARNSFRDKLWAVLYPETKSSG